MKKLLRQKVGTVRRFSEKIRRQVRWAVTPPPVILCYHRIFEPETDPHLLSVSPDRFREQIEVVRRMTQPLSLDRLGTALAEGKMPRRGVVVTFDDGYLDNLKNALPILRAAQVPATIYIATGYVGANREFWWDDLERLLLGPASLPALLQLEIDGQRREWDLAGSAPEDPAWNVLEPIRTPRQRLFCDLHAALRPLPAPRQQDVLRQLRSITKTPLEARSWYRSLTDSELQTLANEPLITLGAHTISHGDLACRDKVEQEAEIAGSKEQLERIIRRPVAHFSYPYGSCNDESIALCAGLNFQSAVTCIAEPVERKSPRYRLPRLLVRNWEGEEFARRFQEFLRG